MPTFSSRPANPSALMSKVRKHPFAFFGLPFISLVVISSFALQNFTQTRYDLNDQKVQSVTKEDELGMSKDRKRVDIREEYYRLNAPASSLSSNDAALDALRAPSGSRDGSSDSSSSIGDSNSNSTHAASGKKKFSLAAKSQDEYEPVRVPRPAGMPEWGGIRGAEDAPLKGQRREDRWV